MGYFSKNWLLSVGCAAKIHDFYNSDLSLPCAAALTHHEEEPGIYCSRTVRPAFARIDDSEVELLLPARPVCLTMPVDVQQSEFWWSICARIPDARFTSSPREIAAASRRFADARFERFSIFLGIIDTGYKASARAVCVSSYTTRAAGDWAGSVEPSSCCLETSHRLASGEALADTDQRHTQQQNLHLAARHFNRGTSLLGPTRREAEATMVENAKPDPD